MDQRKVAFSLLFMRLSVFLVMLVWTLDKFFNPKHAINVYENYYLISGIDHNVIYVLGFLEILLILAFLMGLFKKWTYGAVLILHGISTVSSFKAYIAPYEKGHILFFAAWPMLAACFSLFSLRDLDTMGVVSLAEKKSGE